MIQGDVEGKVVLKNNSLTVGKNGRIRADLYAKMIAVEGSVQGNLYGQEQIVVRQSGNVKGNLVSPRVTIEDGAKFKGSIDMDSAEKLAARAAAGRPEAASLKSPPGPAKEGSAVSGQPGPGSGPKQT
jgi:cytoskeletal protein CcmA (bactofilin family)